MPEKKTKAASPLWAATLGETAIFHPDKNEAELTNKCTQNRWRNQPGLVPREPVAISSKQFFLPGLEPGRRAK